MENYKHIIVDQPEKYINRITLNRPEKRNALSNFLRGELMDALEKADRNDEIRVTIIRGAGTCFSAGYDLGSDLRKDRPWFTSPDAEDGWPRHVTEGWFKMWDMAKPIIAQVHGYCLAGGTELASACDLVYVADDAQIGYPAVRSMTAPDLQFPVWVMGMRAAMQFMLTGAAMSGKKAAQVGFANESFPPEKLEQKVLEMARSVANIPTDLQSLNKRSVYLAMEVMGIRTAIRAGHYIHTLGSYTKTCRDFFTQVVTEGLNKALSDRDGKWGDYGAAKKSLK